MPPAAADRTGPGGIRVGCAGLPPRMSRARYFEMLPFLEVNATFAEPPKASVLRRWRRDAPPDAGFSLLAWQIITHPPPPGRGYPGLSTPLPAPAVARAGHLRDTDVVRAAVARIGEAAGALGAEAILFRTPASLSPSQQNRERMRHFFGEIAPPGAFGGAARVWEPEGLWKPAEAMAFAAELGVVCAWDPLAADPLGEQAAAWGALSAGTGYLRVRRLGTAGGRLTPDDVDTLAEAARRFERAWVVFHTADALRDARAFSRLVGGRDGEPDAPGAAP